MCTEVLKAAASLQEALGGFDPASLSSSDCAVVAERLAATEKACGAARLLAAARAVDGGVHALRGFRDGAAWLARHTGATATQARQALKTAKELEVCPNTKAALVAGDLSVAQASEITQAQSETPGAEKALLEAARSTDLSWLRERAREHRAAHTRAQDLHREQHRARRFRHWRDHLGMVCFDGALPPEVGVPFVHRLETLTHQLRRRIRRSGADLERWEAHGADALAQMTAGSGPKASTRAELVIVCDLFAWRRGHTHLSEVCHIIDGGPIPVSLARQLSKDAFIKAVLHDGVAIHTVTHFGRHQPAELRTALDLGAVPSFSGARCADCGNRWGLEYDHVNPVANGGATRYANLEPRCWKDHHQKTERDRKAGLLGRASQRRPP